MGGSGEILSQITEVMRDAERHALPVWDGT
jgi:hypothetical protein